ncbi:MAG: prepilin peptidase [Peptoniphilaceae bacterium]
MKFLIFIIGSCIGSLMGAFIYRREDIKTFLFGRSRCENCGSIIPIYLNIPIISYLLLKGKCNKCNSKISFLNILIEIITGMIFLLIYEKYGLNLYFFIRLLEACIIIIISFTDLRIKEIYIFDIIILLFLEIFYKYISNSSFLISILSLFTLLLVYFIIFKFTHAMGEGDILFGALSGFFSNSYFDALIIFKNTFIFAAIVSIILIVSKKKNKKDAIALCPYIGMSILKVIL